jgi:hypothetical protein
VVSCSAYNFENNEEWKAHLRNVELPAGNPEVCIAPCCYLLCTAAAQKQQCAAACQTHTSAVLLLCSGHVAENLSMLLRELLTALVQAALLKVKSKWYKRNIDPDFDPAWLTGSECVLL